MLKIRAVQNLSKTGLTLLFLSLLTLADAQQTKHFYKKSQIENHTMHEINFDYIIVQNDTVKNKKYRSLIFHYPPDSISTIRKLQLNYSNGILDGPFYLEKANFVKSDSFPSYHEFQVQHSIKGKSLFAHGNYSQGLRSGQWIQHELTVNDRWTDTLSTTTFQFPKNGEWDGKLTIQDKSLEISGQFSTNLADGNWTGTYTAKPLQLMFEKGVLSSLTIGDSLLKFAINADRYATYTMHEFLTTHLAKSILYRHHFSNEVTSISNKICESIRGFVPNKNLTNSTNSDFQFSAPMIKVPIFELSPIDQESFNNILSTYDQLVHEIEEYTSNPLMLFSSADNKKFAESIMMLELIKERLMIWKPLLETSKSNWHKHIEWGTISPALVKEMNKIFEKSFNFNDELAIVKLSEITYSTNETPITNLKNQLNYLQSVYNKVKLEIDEELTEVQFGEDLRELNQDFANSILTFNTAIAELQLTDFNKQYINGFKHFHNLLVSRFKDASLKSSLNVLEDLLNQSNGLNALLNETSIWEKRHQVIETRYSYLYLDPNTFEERIEILYSQLFKTYERKLMPFAFDQLNFRFNNFNEFEASFQNIQLIQERMLTLLDENPRKLNRKLKNRDTIYKVTQKIGLILN